MIDVLSEVGEKTYEVFPNKTGFVRLVDMMPRLVPEGQTADMAIVQAARVSYGQGTKKVSEDRGLIRYLLRHQHTTPFEMIRFKFHLRLPIFVWRQATRHRTADEAEVEITSTDDAMRKFVGMNEYSARYSIVPEEMFLPDPFRKQSASNKQGGEEPVDEDLNRRYQSAVAHDQVLARTLYDDMLKDGVSRELARTHLPLSTITELYLSMDLWNLMRFLKLRTDPHAQKEIREVADRMAFLLRKTCPISYEAWLDYMVNAHLFTEAQMDLLLQASYQGAAFDWHAPREDLTAREVLEVFDKLMCKTQRPGSTEYVGV